MASALDIMIDGPIGAASFNNEYGRPAISGYFRSFEMPETSERGQPSVVRGYHKPVMIAGGIGSVREEHVNALPFPEGTALVVLGGPVMLIGLGGGAASSMASGMSSSDLDFAQCSAVIQKWSGVVGRSSTVVAPWVKPIRFYLFMMWRGRFI